MFYLFPYNGSSGALYPHPYYGTQSVMDNPPSGYTILGPFPDTDTTAQAAYQACESLQPWQYVVENSALIANPQTDVIALTQAQAAQIALLTSGYNATLTGGFASSATGTSETYGSAAADYTNMTELMTANNAGITTWPFPWQLPSGAVVDLTQTQFLALCKDAQAWKVAQIQQLRSLAGQVQAATTVAAVQAVVWTPGIPA